MDPTAQDMRQPPIHRPAAAEVPRSQARSSCHWDSVYTDRGPGGVSWFQPEPRMSLELITALGIGTHAAVIDVGAGASLLVDRLVADDFTDVTVLDISAAALRASRLRLDGHPAVTWLCADLLTWHPSRHYDLWHDRAVFHFLTDPADRRTYLATARAALHPGGHLILAAFASDGPEQCSGLPVTRYSPDDLAATLGDGFYITHVRREEHTTPAGGTQPFTWIAAQAL